LLGAERVVAIERLAQLTGQTLKVLAHTEVEERALDHDRNADDAEQNHQIHDRRRADLEQNHLGTFDDIHD
jgi:ABC-type Zn2+ transport system substrate-binding protein/surface adhesin